MARLFISYKREEKEYALALRQWLMDVHGWIERDIFVDFGHLHAGDEWESKLLEEAEMAEAMLFIASSSSLDFNSFCYIELRHAKGQILAVTIKGLQPDDDFLLRAIPDRAKTRQITQLDREPTRPYTFTSPGETRAASVLLNEEQVESIGSTLRDLGIAPNSFKWQPTTNGPYPGLSPLREGDEAIFCGRDIEIRDGLKMLEDVRDARTKRALIIQAPSGAGKSSFLQAGLWRRLRSHAGFTPLAIVRPAQGAISHSQWGLAAGLKRTLAASTMLAGRLNLSLAAIERRIEEDLPGLLRDFADADAQDDSRRTIVIGIDQAEEMATLDDAEREELNRLLAALFEHDAAIDCLLVLTARDDTVDSTIQHLSEAGVAQEQVADFRLHRLPAVRFDEIIAGPVLAAQRAGFPLSMDPALTDALATAAAENQAEGGDALPILALTLQRLYEKCRLPDGRIDLLPNHAAQFIDASVADAVADALARVDANTDDLRRLIIPRLATWDPQAGIDGAAKRRVTTGLVLFSGTRRHLKSLADSLVQQRLLTRSSTSSGPVYEVSHEALLRVEPLGSLVYECRNKFELARLLKGEAAEWDSDGRIVARLARVGARLEEAERLLHDIDFAADLDAEGTPVSDYVEACAQHAKDQAHQRRRREQAEQAAVRAREDAERAQIEYRLTSAREKEQASQKLLQRTKIGLAFAVLCVAVAAVTGFLAYERGNAAKEMKNLAQQQRDDALLTQSRYLTGLAQQQLRDGDAGAAMLLGLAALPDVDPAAVPVYRRPYWAPAEVVVNQAFFQHRETQLLKGHHNAVLTIAASQHLIVTGSRDGTAIVWTAGSAGWQASARLDARAGEVTDALILADGRILTESSRGVARVWRKQLDQWAIETRLEDGADNIRHRAHLLSDGRLLRSSQSRTQIWTQRGDEGWVIEAIVKGRALLVARADRVVTVSQNRSNFNRPVLQIWDESEDGWQSTIIGDSSVSGVVHAIVELADQRLVVATEEGLQVWQRSADRWDLIATQRVQGTRRLAVLDARRIVSAGSQGKLTTWEINKDGFDHVSEVTAHSLGISGLAVLEGNRLASASFDGTARIWNTDSPDKLHQVLPGSTVFSLGDENIVTHAEALTESSEVTIWRQNDGRWIVANTVQTDIAYQSLVGTFNGKFVVESLGDNVAQIWALSGTDWALESNLEGHTNTITQILELGGHRIVTASYDGSLRIWQRVSQSWEPRAVLEKHTEGVTSVALLPDGRLVSGSDDGTIRIWTELQNSWADRVLSTHGVAVHSVDVLSDGRIVSATSDGKVWLWAEAKAGWEIQTKIDLSGTSLEKVRVVHGDGIATVGSTVDIWKELDGQWQRVSSLVYGLNLHKDIVSLFDESLAVSSLNKQIWIHPRVPGSTEEVVAAVKGKAARCLDPDQRTRYHLPNDVPDWCTDAEVWPYDRDSLIYLGWRRMADESDAEADRYFAKAVSIDPSLQETVSRYRIQGYLSRARESLVKSDDPRAGDWFEKAAALDSSLHDEINSMWTEAHLGRGVEALVSGDDDSLAQQHFAAALKFDSTLEDVVAAHWAQVYFERGILLLAEQEDREADKAFALALEKDPEKQSEIDRSRAEVQIQRGKEEILAWSSDANERGALDMAHAGRSEFDAALSIDPSLAHAIRIAKADAFTSLGRSLLFRSGENEAHLAFKEAAKQFAAVSPAETESPELLAAMVNTNYRAGVSHFQRGLNSDSLSHVAAAIDALGQPGQADASVVLYDLTGETIDLSDLLVLRARNYLALQRYDEALEDLAQSSLIDSNEPAVYSLRGQIYEKKDLIVEAVIAYHRALRLAQQSNSENDDLSIAKDRVHILTGMLPGSNAGW